MEQKLELDERDGRNGNGRLRFKKADVNSGSPSRKSVAKFICGFALMVAAILLAVVGARAAAPAEQVDILMGPYVNFATGPGARILWVASAGATGSCAVEAAPGHRGQAPEVSTKTSPIAGRPERLHVATVTGLTPGQQYRYTVTCGGGPLEGAFRTAPPADAEAPLKFAVYGDSRAYPSRHRAVVEAMAGEMPFDFFVNTGDLVNDGRVWEQWKTQLFDPAQQLLQQAVFWPVVGNHEEDAVLFCELFELPHKELYYSFDAGPVHFVVLDSEYRGRSAQAAMLAWLELDLAASKAPWTIMSFHRPSFNVGGHGSTWGQDDVVPIIHKYGVDLVLSGHSHLYERFKPIGKSGQHPTIYVVTGGGGAPTDLLVASPMLEASYSGLHYCVFEVDGKRLSMMAKTPEGEVLDRFTLTKTNGRFQTEVMDAAVSIPQAKALM